MSDSTTRLAGHVFRERHPLPKASRDTATHWEARVIDDQNVEHGRWRRVYVDDAGQHFTLSTTPERYTRHDLEVPA